MVQKWQIAGSVLRHPSTPFQEASMTKLKLRALPYAGVLTFVASMAGYFGTR